MRGRAARLPRDLGSAAGLDGHAEDARRIGSAIRASSVVVVEVQVVEDAESLAQADALSMPGRVVAPTRRERLERDPHVRA